MSRAPVVVDTDEYGNVREDGGPHRYGWLGAEQRSAETPTGLLLMRARLYDPTTGRFLSVDPVTGGSCNSYEYVCGDPVNLVDLDGRMTAVALVGMAGLGVSAGTVLAVIGVGAVVAITGLIWWKGGKRAGESIDEAVDRIFREHYGRNPTPKERRNGHEWKKIQKNLTKK